MGPTGAGKTALAETLYRQGGFELVSVDSAQVYRRMNLGTAKPTAEQLIQVPHHLIDIREPWETYSAAEFSRDAGLVMAAIRSRDCIPVLVGGTLLYYRALLEGLSDLPEASAEIREQIAKEGEDLGWQQMHTRLAQVDPAAAERIHPNDPQRIQRALEVFRATGSPISSLQKNRQGAAAGAFLKIAVSPQERHLLHDSINRRFEQMLDAGLLEEVRQLMDLPQLSPDMPSMRAVGYRQSIAHLNGEYDLSQLILRGQAATRQLAKRQLTGLRQLENVQWLDPTIVGWESTGLDWTARFLHKTL